MLEHLKVQNYQILKDVDLELKKFTAIVGSSGNGKSSVVRALRSIFTAQAGVSAVRHGSGEYKIGVQVDGKTIAWAKGKKKNVYVTGPNPGDRYDKVGLEVPPAAAQAFNLGVAYFGDVRSVVNIQDQHDSPFLISESGSVVSEFLGSVSGLDKLFAVVDEIAGDIRRTKITTNDREATLVKINDQVNSLTPFQKYKDTIDTLVSGLSDIEKGLDEVIHKKQLCVTLASLNEEILRYENVISKHPLEIVDQYLSDIKILDDKINSLDEQRGKFIEYGSLEKQITDMGKVEGSVKKILSKCGKDFDNVKVSEKAQESLLLVAKSLKAQKSEEGIIRRNYDVFSREVSALLKEAETSLPEQGLCPTCMQEVTEVCMKDIIKKFKEQYAVSNIC